MFLQDYDEGPSVLKRRVRAATNEQARSVSLGGRLVRIRPVFVDEEIKAQRQWIDSPKDTHQPGFRAGSIESADDLEDPQRAL
jgi:hypothetical protein